MWDAIRDATTGRGELRLILQPVIAVLFGIRLGLADAHTGPPAHELRSALIPLAIAIVIDAYMQILSRGHLSWFAALVVGTALIYVPYGIARSLTRRIDTYVHARP